VERRVENRTARRFGRIAFVRVAPLLLLVALAGCDIRQSGRPERPTSGEAGEEVESTVPAEFAETLGVDLESMRQTPSGLYIQDLVEGRGLAARSGHVVVVHYTGWLPNGDQFDSSRDAGEARSFQLGARRDVITGWEEGVTGMRIGGKRLLVVPPHLAYGARGVPGAIPPNATLVYEFELLEIRM
jgi:FKBP-type peptidyl-prolyl cis-trans isomerase FkpA